MAFGIQHAMHVCHSPRVTSPALQYFSALSHKRHDFREKEVSEHKVCVGVFSTTFLILRTERNMIINVFQSSCKVPVTLVRF